MEKPSSQSIASDLRGILSGLPDSGLPNFASGPEAMLNDKAATQTMQNIESKDVAELTHQEFLNGEKRNVSVLV